MSGADACLAAIARALPSDRVITDLAVREAHARDESEAEGAIPDAVIRARGAAEIAVVMREASSHRVPVTPRGGGTGRTGGAVPVRGGIVLACDRMTGMDLVRGDALAIVEPGLVARALHDAVEAEGLFFGPDPNSWDQCTIGGNVAANAGGPRAFRHGTMREWVLGLEIVTAGGEILEVGRRTRKGSSGYDLTSLIVGSEGTLAIVTRATLRLAPRAESVVALLAFLPTHAAVAAAIESALARGIVPRCVELLDDLTLDVLRGASSTIPIPEAARALLVIELEGRERVIEEDLQIVGEALALHTFGDPLVAVTVGERERFWSVRRDMSRALRRTARSKLSEDVVVPRSRLAELIARVREISGRHGVRMPAYGHAGDGNLHVNLLWDDPAQRPAVDAAIRELFEATVALGGSLSGEHGIGALKAPYFAIEHSAASIAAQQRLKAALDPAGVLNPGKIFAGAAGHGGC